MDKFELLAILIVTVAAAPLVWFFGYIAVTMFREWRRKRCTRTLSVPVFGTLEQDGQLWVTIPPDTDFDFMVVVVADESGPSIRQQRFFEEITASLARYEDEAKALVKSRNTEENVDALTLYSIEIGTDDELVKGRFVLELADKDEYDVHRVEFEEFTASQYTIDD